METKSNEDGINPIFFEKILIKFLFINPEVRDKVFSFLSPKFFDDHKNIHIIKTILKFHERFEKFPSIPEVKIDIDSEPAFDQLKEIMDMDISDYNNEFLISEIEEFLKMKLINNINVDIAMSLHENDIDKLKETPDNLREALAFSFDSHIGLDFLEEEERLYEHLHNKEIVIPSMFRELNQSIEGGFHTKSLTLFMAETNLGKSLIMTSLGVDCILSNKNVLYITCEMSEEKISERIMTNLFDMSLTDLKYITKDQFHAKFEKYTKEMKRKIFIKEYAPKSINSNDIRNLLKDLEVRKKFKPDIIFIDYLGIMNAVHNNKSDNSYLEVKRISEEVRGLAVDFKLPIISAVQSGRQSFSSAEIDLADVSDSIGIVSTADIVIGIVQTPELREQGKFNWLILKNRYGINKVKITVNVDYYKMRVFEDPNSTLVETARSGSISKTEKEKTDKIKDAVQETKNIINKDNKDKFNKVVGWE